VVDALASLGLSSICNVMGAIKTARHYGFGPDDVILTVATDGSRMYSSELHSTRRRYFPDGFDDVAAGEVFGQHVLGASTDHLLELTHRDRERVFNLGYFTWVEQQGISVEDFEARRAQRFWRDLQDLPAVWDHLIEEFNQRSGAVNER
jgi:hypothetical protein